MKTPQENAALFAEKIMSNNAFGFENNELFKELITQCYMAGVEESNQWYSFDDEMPPKNTRINTIDTHGDICSFIFKSGDIKLSAKLLGFVKWKPINF
jgi:hypothetical protein